MSQAAMVKPDTEGPSWATGFSQARSQEEDVVAEKREGRFKRNLVWKLEKKSRETSSGGDDIKLAGEEPSRRGRKRSRSLEASSSEERNVRDQCRTPPSSWTSVDEASLKDVKKRIKHHIMDCMDSSRRATAGKNLLS
jgi:hypothetical protein